MSAAIASGIAVIAAGSSVIAFAPVAITFASVVHGPKPAAHAVASSQRRAWKTRSLATRLRMTFIQARPPGSRTLLCSVLTARSDEVAKTELRASHLLI